LRFLYGVLIVAEGIAGVLTTKRSANLLVRAGPLNAASPVRAVKRTTILSLFREVSASVKDLLVSLIPPRHPFCPWYAVSCIQVAGPRSSDAEELSLPQGHCGPTESEPSANATNIRQTLASTYPLRKVSSLSSSDGGKVSQTVASALQSI
jgi:hypothetical protein